MGVDELGLARVRAQLEDFAAEAFAGLPRSDQRATGLRYLRGLMLDGRRKSMQPMAQRLGVDHQQLQQFLTSSTWDVKGVRRRLATAAVDLVAAQVWVVDDTGFPKDGRASACVSRQYSGTLGKVANCQIAVTVHAATDAASAVLDWRLFVPESWDDTCVPDTSFGRGGPGGDRRLHRARQMAIKAICRRLGVSRNTVCRALAGHGPPRDQRAAKRSIVDAVEPQIRALLAEFPDMPTTVIMERVAWTRGRTVFADRMQQLRSLFRHPDPVNAAVLAPLWPGRRRGR